MDETRCHRIVVCGTLLSPGKKMQRRNHEILTSARDRTWLETIPPFGTFQKKSADLKTLLGFWMKSPKRNWFLLNWQTLRRSRSGEPISISYVTILLQFVQNIPVRPREVNYKTYGIEMLLKLIFGRNEPTYVTNFPEYEERRKHEKDDHKPFCLWQEERFITFSNST